MFSIISIFWFFRESKYILFWLYLWQLKEYHIARILDHFKTEKGKKLFLNPILFAKIVLSALLLISNAFFAFCFFVLFLIYLLECGVFAKTILAKQIKKPVKTSKTLFLIFTSFAALILSLWGISQIANEPSVLFYFLAFDILTPLIVSAVVLIFQPLFIYARNNILKKATEKRNTLKDLTVIGITGSYGKTSTKEFLTTILSKKFKVVSTKEHQNSEIGIANCILNDLSAESQILIVEMGAYDKGKVKEVCFMAKPKIGVVTGVNEQHLALFGSLKNLLSAEGGGELAESLPKNGILVVNGDNKFCLDLLRKSSNLPVNQEKKYTLGNKAIDGDIWTEDIVVEKNSISFVTVNKGGEMGHFKVNVLGGHNAQNLLGAILVARELGMSIEEISEACKSVKQEQAGMVLKQGKDGLDIIDSSYSANPDGIFADLDYLNIFPNKKAVIMPCLIELGPKSSEIHQKIGKKIAQVCGLAVITSKDKFEDIKKGAVEAGMKHSSILLCDNPDEVATIISLFCKQGDAVLLEGRVPSKLHELF